MKFALLYAVALLTGCSTATHPVSTAGKVASGTVTLAGRTAASVTGSAVQVTKASVTAAGKVASATTSGVVKVAQTPFVIFKDKSSGKSKQIPWEKGMTMASASKVAGTTTRVVAFQVRRGQAFLKGNSQLLLQPGDVIERFARTASTGRF